jgi:transposase-like protein
MTNKLYCNCCDSAYVETSEKVTDDHHYLCSICREYCEHLDVDARENNFDKTLVTEYSND